MAGLTETIYLNSPVAVQQMIAGVYGWWWYRRRFSRAFHQLVAEFKARERWAAQQFDDYQTERLGQLLAAAWRAPHYRRVFEQTGLTWKRRREQRFRNCRCSANKPCEPRRANC